jgi:hypothetical protein
MASIAIHAINKLADRKRRFNFLRKNGRTQYFYPHGDKHLSTLYAVSSRHCLYHRQFALTAFLVSMVGKVPLIEFSPGEHSPLLRTDRWASVASCSASTAEVSVVDFSFGAAVAHAISHPSCYLPSSEVATTHTQLYGAINGGGGEDSSVPITAELPTSAVQSTVFGAQSSTKHGLHVDTLSIETNSVSVQTPFQHFEI